LRKVLQFQVVIILTVLLASLAGPGTSMVDAAGQPAIKVGGESAEEQGHRPGETVIFEQPILGGVAGNFHVPIAERKYPSDRQFTVILWQPNPNRLDGELVPTNWSAGDKTGFYPAGALREHQSAFIDAYAESTVQIEAGTIGAYVRSADLPNGSHGDKMMITPVYTFPKQTPLRPFLRPGDALVNSLELQIPVAQDANKPGNYTYVNPVFFFIDIENHTQISYDITVFHHALHRAPPPTPESLRKTEVGAFDGPTHSYQVGNALSVGSRVVLPLSGTTLYQNQPWKGWRIFRFAITRNNFQSALKSLKERDPGFLGSENPSDYVLTEWHLNAELNFTNGPAELGWSLRKTRIALIPEIRLMDLVSQSKSPRPRNISGRSMTCDRRRPWS
jgi:hypothetical protein